jgi:hypothetical protein
MICMLHFIVFSKISKGKNQGASYGPGNRVINLLTYNFSKEQCTLPEDDLWIETCRSVLNVLV